MNPPKRLLYPGAALDPAPAGDRRVFVTSARDTGRLAAWADAQGQTGLAAGDAICRAAATRARVPNAGRFTAWLSDSTTSVSARITAEGPWRRLDGALVATDRTSLLAGAIASPIAVDETGRYRGGVKDSFGVSAWTGTTSSGTSATTNCGDWKVGGGAVGRGGFAYSAARTQWSDQQAPDCGNYAYSLYCFEN